MPSSDPWNAKQRATFALCAGAFAGAIVVAVTNQWWWILVSLAIFGGFEVIGAWFQYVKNRRAWMVDRITERRTWDD
jgi:hypothetical protein